MEDVLSERRDSSKSAPAECWSPLWSAVPQAALWCMAIGLVLRTYKHRKVWPFLWNREGWGHARGPPIYKLSSTKEQTRSLKEDKEFPHQVISLIRAREKLSLLTIMCVRPKSDSYGQVQTERLLAQSSTLAHFPIWRGVYAQQIPAELWILSWCLFLVVLKLGQRHTKNGISEKIRDKTGHGACTIAFHV